MDNVQGAKPDPKAYALYGCNPVTLKIKSDENQNNDYFW